MRYISTFCVKISSTGLDGKVVQWHSNVLAHAISKTSVVWHISETLYNLFIPDSFILYILMLCHIIFDILFTFLVSYSNFWLSCTSHQLNILNNSWFEALQDNVIMQLM